MFTNFLNPDNVLLSETVAMSTSGTERTTGWETVTDTSSVTERTRGWETVTNTSSGPETTTGSVINFVYYIYINHSSKTYN